MRIIGSFEAKSQSSEEPSLSAANIREVVKLIITTEAWHAGNWQGYQEAR